MANRFQSKRTAVSGRTANTTNSGNSQYIAAGEFALNMADRILYTSDGTNLITIGANQVNMDVSANLTVNRVIANNSIGAPGYVLTSNGSSTYWTSPGAASVDQSAQYTWTNTHTFSNTIIVTTIEANSTIGTDGQVLTSNGSIAYWADPTGGGGGGVTAVRQQFSGTGACTEFTVSGGYTPYNMDVYLNGVKLFNGTDVDVSDGSIITISPAPASGALIEIVGASNTAVTGGVSAITAGNGLNGGVILTSGTISVNAQDGLISNSLGLYVNTSFINTLDANNASYLNSQTGSYYTNASNLDTGLVPTARLGTGTANSTTYLAGDNTWQTISAGGSGVNVDSQYTWTNNHTFLANTYFGDPAGANNITISENYITTTSFDEVTIPPVPADGDISIFAKTIAGRLMISQVGPSGLDSALQPMLGRNCVGFWRGIAGATTNSGLGIALTATGTANAATWATTNLHTSMNRLSFRATTASATAVAGFRGGALNYFRGNASGRGGFTYICRWGPGTAPTAPVNTNQRAFVGLRSSTTAPTDVAPSTLTNAIGMGWESSSANLQLYSAGTAMSQIDTGIPLTKGNETNVFELVMFCPPNGTYINYQITDLVNNLVYTRQVVTSTNLPSTTTGLNIYGYVSAGGTSSTESMDLMGIYMETDL